MRIITTVNATKAKVNIPIAQVRYNNLALVFSCSKATRPVIDANLFSAWFKFSVGGLSPLVVSS